MWLAGGEAGIASHNDGECVVQCWERTPESPRSWRPAHNHTMVFAINIAVSRPYLPKVNGLSLTRLSYKRLRHLSRACVLCMV